MAKAVGIDPAPSRLIVTINLGAGHEAPPVASMLKTAGTAATADVWKFTKTNV
ncbi:MAG TPA: hypothetical protein VEG37_10490 [Burkholderiales bacterium]|nr:hypothetical protein [Burkholderiales bacterium]